MIMVGSPVLALGEPTSLYLVAARKAEKSSEHRTAIFCLCNVLLEILDKRPASAGLNRSTLISELKLEFSKIGLEEKVIGLSEPDVTKLHQFLETELSASDPGSGIEVFSDGSFRITRKKWDSPSKLRILCTLSSPDGVIRKGSPGYESQLKKYWWFKMPPPEVLATKPTFVPDKSVEKTELDGAFAGYNK